MRLARSPGTREEGIEGRGETLDDAKCRDRRGHGAEGDRSKSGGGYVAYGNNRGNDQTIFKNMGTEMQVSKGVIKKMTKEVTRRLGEHI